MKGRKIIFDKKGENGISCGSIGLKKLKVTKTEKKNIFPIRL